MFEYFWKILDIYWLQITKSGEDKQVFTFWYLNIDSNGYLFSVSEGKNPGLHFIDESWLATMKSC